MAINWRDLLDNWNDPAWIRDRFEHHVSGTFSGFVYGFDGVDVPSLDWDNLIILDACRADLFEDVIDLDRFDEYRRVPSRGSSTEEWVLENWVGREFPEITYVTANPVVARYTPKHFYNRVDVFESGFDDEFGTVLPHTMARITRDTFQADKRIVAHFMQPHYPFYAGELDVGVKSWHPDGGDDGRVLRNPWEAIAKSEVEKRDVIEAYRTTLSDALPIALELADELPGTSVVTSDHGNTYGRWAFPLPFRIYGHPTGFRYPELVSVPWGVMEGDARDIRSGHISTQVASAEVVQNRLEAFGYISERNTPGTDTELGNTVS